MEENWSNTVSENEKEGPFDTQDAEAPLLASTVERARKPQAEESEKGLHRPKLKRLRQRIVRNVSFSVVGHNRQPKAGRRSWLRGWLRNEEVLLGPREWRAFVSYGSRQSKTTEPLGADAWIIRAR